MQSNELDELDNEVAMISQKSPKGQGKQPKTEKATGKAVEKDESNTRNFNSIPRNYNDPSDNSNNEAEEGKKNEEEKEKSPPQSPGHASSVVNSITIYGARGMQSKINLIPLFNIKNLFHRNNRLEEVLEIEYMSGLSLICSRRYVQASESFKRVQAKILNKLKESMREEFKGDIAHQKELAMQDPKDSKHYADLMRAAELEILIAECYNAQGKELDKIYSFKRATELYLGMLVKPSEYQKTEYYPEDVHSILTKISPYLINMLLELCKHEDQEVQIAALRGIEFLLEKLGCTLDD